MTLADFGVTEAPPHFKKDRRITHTHGERTRTVGWIGLCPERECRAYASARNSEGHKIHKLDAWGISESVLERLGALGVGRVFIVETDTDTVREFTMRAWKSAANVPDGIASEPQRYLGDDNAVATWPDHRGEFYLPRDADV